MTAYCQPTSRPRLALLHVVRLVLVMLVAGCASPSQSLRVGSKLFAESVILGEAITQLAQSTGTPTVHRRELGGSQVLWHALLAGSIDVYPEYTGTIASELLANEHLAARDESALRAALARRGVRMSAPLGFEDNYAIGMRASVAQRLGIVRISDLRAHPELAFGFSHEFLERPEGWPGLHARYDLNPSSVRGLQHELAYRALLADSIAVTDLYSTDAEILSYDLRVLQDDREHFPPYRAVLLYRDDLTRRAPEVVAALQRLVGAIETTAMVRMNARSRIDRVPEASIASQFLATRFGLRTQTTQNNRVQRITARTIEHLRLVLLSLLSAVVTAVPLGVLAARRPRLGALLLGAVGLVQTIPSLALLVFMIPLLGIGAPPAIAALFIYSLLPIVQNTASGLTGIPSSLRESADALGLSSRARLRLIELPLAMPSMLAGIKTAAVINVGTATLGALIGAGGYGEPIMTGIRRDHLPTILEGAIPAAVMALATQALFVGLERVLVSEGLRKR